MTNTHLHLHTKFSVGDALPSSLDYAKAAGEGSILAITDHDNMSGIVEHEIACRRVGVKSVFGVEVTNPDGYRTTLLARTEVGLKNLFSLCAIPRTRENLALHSEGVIALSGDLCGEIPVSILRRDVKHLRDALGFYREVYGNNFYLEEIDHGLAEQSWVNDRLRAIGLPVVKTNDVHYLSEDDAVTHHVLMCDKFSRVCNLSHLPYKINREAWLKPIHCEVAEHIGLSCNVTLSLGQHYLPAFETPPGFNDEKDYLFYKGREGLRKKLLDTAEYRQRLDYELEVISGMEFAGYFLIVHDFVSWAKENGIPVGPGRGSGAGSLTAYALDITDIDPIKHNLIFERFLNPDRVSMPDFDIDFGQEGRGEVVRYVASKYPNTCQIGTFSELKPRSAFRAAARVLGMRAGEVDRISGMFPDGVKDTTKISEIFDDSGNSIPDSDKEHLIELCNGDPFVMDTTLMAMGLEGRYKSVGKHAAGVLIGDRPLSEIIPVWSVSDPAFTLSKDEDEAVTRLVSQLQATDAEKMGLVKFDFLGIKELDVIKKTIDLLRSRGDSGPNMSSIPLDDKRTFEMIASGNTLGCFQISSSGMTALCQDMQVSCFEDLVAAVALYRPGPMDAGMHTVYARRKRGDEPVEYDHEDLRETLGSTYGIIVFQEQVMQIARKISGYSMADADNLRRVIGKKKVEEMDLEIQRFMDGGRKQGYSEEILARLWSQIETFARYGFCRAHAVSYAMIAYQTAYLKAHYTAEFLAAQMEIRKDDFETVSSLIRNARDMKINVSEPEIGRSMPGCHVRGGNIIVGINALRGVRSSALGFMDGRSPDNFNSLTSFFGDVNVDGETLKALVYSGAMDTLLKKSAPSSDIYQSRLDLIEQRKDFQGEFKRGRSPGGDRNQGDLFAMPEIKLKPGVAASISLREMLDLERHYLGRFRTGHPTMISRPQHLKKIEDIEMGSFSVLCFVSSVHEVSTKRGDLMAFVTLEDFTGSIEAVIFSDEWDSPPDMEGSLIQAELFADLKNGRKSYILNSWRKKQ